MKKTKSMRLAVLAAGLLCCSIFTVPAYAQSSEPQEETPPAQEAPAETETQPETQNPFSTNGTGTVVDNATDEEGKEFYTITTPDENIFYLVIDKQKTTDNVYFLNAVTEADLLPLAENGTGARTHGGPGGNRRARTGTRGRSPGQQSPCHPPCGGCSADRWRCRVLLQDLQAETSGPGFGGRLLRV